MAIETTSAISAVLGNVIHGEATPQNGMQAQGQELIAASVHRAAHPALKSPTVQKAKVKPMNHRMRLIIEGLPLSNENQTELYKPFRKAELAA